MTPSTASFLGIDVGGTKILGVAADPATGSISHQCQRQTPRDDQASVIEAISSVAAELTAIVDPVAIGVGIPGLVDHQGVLRYGPNVPGILDLDMAGELRARFGLPVIAENDASNAALAEHRFGAAKGAMHAVIITQGTGIGGALIIGGRLLRGANGFAGEPGHMLVNEGGHMCACGQRGCWESVASGTGLANVAREIVAEGRGQRVLELAGGVPDHIRGEHVSAAGAEGDAGALEIFDSFAFWVAQGLGSLITLLDPEVVVLGGGLTVISPSFISDVQSRVMAAVMGGQYRPRVPIVPAMLGAEAGAVGAAINARDIFVAP
jgi:glucokinase